MTDTVTAYARLGRLLDDPDRRVRQQEAGEQRVGGPSGGKDHHEEGRQDEVEQRERVRAHDACVRPARGELTARAERIEPAAGLGLGQPRVGRRGG
jgi:hypothetical protein